MPGAPEHFQAAKYFSMTPEVPGSPTHFSKVVQAQQCLKSFEIILYDFWKTPGVPGCTTHFSEVV